MKAKIKVFINENSEALAEAINNDSTTFFATQVFQKHDYWIAFCYYNENN